MSSRRAGLAAAVAAGVCALALPAPAEAATWCGGAPADADRLPDAEVGAQFHLVYAVPADGGDAFGEWAPRMVADQEAVRAWWLTQDPARAPRLDLHAVPCDTELGQLDITSVRLPQLALFYGESSLIGDRMRDDLRRMGLDHPRKKYVVYYDAPVTVRGFCAQSTGTSFGWGIALVYVRTERCDLLDDRFRRHVVAHEMVHTLDVPTNSLRIPHLCRDDRGHFCDSDLDLMTGLPTRRIGLDTGVVLDFGNDDYYGHGDTWWDAQDSPFLEATRAARVSVLLGGPGGVIRSSDGSLECPVTCSAEIELGKRVTLTAAPDPGWRFAGWGGRCRGPAEGCVVRVDGELTVTAAFAPLRRTLRVIVGAGGRVALSTGKSCVRDCPLVADHGARVSLTARPARGHRFVRWSGACAGARTTCTVTLSGDRSARATFAARR